MRATKAAVQVMCAIALLLGAATQVLAVAGPSASATGEWITTDPNAPYTKYTGPFSIQYVWENPPFVAQVGPAAGQLVNTGDVTAYWEIRLKQGVNLWGFSGTVTGLDYGNADEMTNSAIDLIENDVLPGIFGCTAGLDCPTIWALKTVDNLVQDECWAVDPARFWFEADCGLFLVMDITLAIDD